MGSSLLILVPLVFCFSISNLVFYGLAIESPKYKLVHLNQIMRSEPTEKPPLCLLLSKEPPSRIYQRWLSQDLPIHPWRNINSLQLPITAPVLTSVITSSPKTVYCVKLFLPEGNPPQPNTELNLQLEKRSAQCMAVRKFFGFAEDDNVKKEKKALMASVTEHPTGNTVLDDNISYIIAQCNSSYHPSGRLNEVWIDVSGFNVEGCLPQQGKY